MTNTKPIWYFDFISPYAYIQFERLKQLAPDLEMEFKPVLFAGLLKNWGHKGPVEIPAKRPMTYRYCHWLANKHNIKYQTPPSHPFNPLLPLRLSIGLNNDFQVIDTLFQQIWGLGQDIADPKTIANIQDILQLDNLNQYVEDASVKEKLRTNTEDAIQSGVFGVPTLSIRGELFWGVDMTEMALEFLNDPAVHDSPEYDRLANLPGYQK